MILTRKQRRSTRLQTYFSHRALVQGVLISMLFLGCGSEGSDTSSDKASMGSDSISSGQAMTTPPNASESANPSPNTSDTDLTAPSSGTSDLANMAAESTDQSSAGPVDSQPADGETSGAQMGNDGATPDAPGSDDSMTPADSGQGSEPTNQDNSPAVIEPDPDEPQVAPEPSDGLPASGPCEPEAENGHLYSMSAESLSREREVSMCDYRGRVMLIVNTAAKCGFTPQYEALSEIYETYRLRGFSVLGFLSNDFRQAGTEEENEACVDMYALKFERFAQVGVLPNSADGQHPIFAWLTNQTGLEGNISWNFNKFLVGADGELIARWNQSTAPNSAQITDAIEAALQAANEE